MAYRNYLNASAQLNRTGCTELVLFESRGLDSGGECEQLM